MKRLYAFVLICVLAAACTPAPLTAAPNDPQPAPVSSAASSADVSPAVEAPAFTPRTLDAGWGYESADLSVYFTDPNSPNARSRRGGIDTPLADAIRNARQSVDLAVYNLTLWSIRDALIEAHRNGVNVRVVMDVDNARDEDEPQEIADAGIPLVVNDGNGLMHNKFVVIDRQEVWIGSMNYTVSGAYMDDNNMVRVRSTEAAESYTREFEEMFTDQLFGANTRTDTPYRDITVSGVPIEIYFSPDDGVADRIVELLNGAQTSIDFMAFSFTSDDFAEAIQYRADAGVQVRGVMDEEQVSSNQGTEYDLFRQLGLLVYEDGHNGSMHHKVFIIDSAIVITGSYNFSASAETRNDENIMVIFSPEIAAMYLEEFERVYDDAKR